MHPGVTTIPEGPVLKGYSWVTICAREAALALGGAEVLAAAGAFHEVAELPSGAVWLQATERYDEYEEVVATRVFRALAPVLPGGLPSPGPAEQTRIRLAWRDADWYRRGGILNRRGWTRMSQQRGTPVPAGDRPGQCRAGTRRRSRECSGTTRTVYGRR